MDVGEEREVEILGRRWNLYSSRRGRDFQPWRVFDLSEKQQARGNAEESGCVGAYLIISHQPIHSHFSHFFTKRALGAPPNHRAIAATT